MILAMTFVSAPYAVNATREAFESWREGFDGDVLVRGSEHVDSVAWHVAPATDTIVAATFHAEEEAAVGTLRRQAYGKVYRDIVTGDDGSEESPEGSES